MALTREFGMVFACGGTGGPASSVGELQLTPYFAWGQIRSKNISLRTASTGRMTFRALPGARPVVKQQHGASHLVHAVMDADVALSPLLTTGLAMTADGDHGGGIWSSPSPVGRQSAAPPPRQSGSSTPLGS